MPELITARTVDLETTSFPPEGVVVEAGYVDTVLRKENDVWVPEQPIIQQARQKYFHPGDNTMSVEARSVHHITDGELEGADPHTSMPAWVRDGDPQIYVAHNADFEMNYIQIPESSYWVDTYKVALRLFPDADKHNNQFLRYYLGLDLGDEAMPPHRALPDAYTTAHIFCAMLPMTTVREMILWSAQEVYLPKVTFGKYVGQRWEDIPADYARWCLRQDDMKPGVHAACRRRLGMEQ